MKKIIAANWKNNGSKEFIKNYFDYFAKNLNNTNKNEIIFFPPDLYMDQIDKYSKKLNFSLGGQNFTSSGDDFTLTGGTSSKMFIDNGCSHILIGHSEMRLYGFDTYTPANLLCFTHDHLQAILCVGEDHNDKKNNHTSEKISKQLKDLYENEFIPKKVIIAYEPVWAIGSGKIPTLDNISFIHRFIKNNILEKLPSLKEKDIMVLYGGSVNLKNAEDILSAPHVDGVLIGGASLEVKEFTSICNLKI